MIAKLFWLAALIVVAQPAQAASVIWAGVALNWTYIGSNIYQVEGYHTVSVSYLEPADANANLLLDGAIRRCPNNNTQNAGAKSGVTGEDFFLDVSTKDPRVHCQKQEKGWTRGRILHGLDLRAEDEIDGGCEGADCSVPPPP